MKNRIACFLAEFLILFSLVSGATAQNIPPIGLQRVFAQQELDQMLAPIALYPDALLSQILMASTYPPEVAQAAQWSRSNPGMRGDQAVQAVAGYGWDPSVKSLVAFPEILSTMASRMDWTMDLGEAFLGQQPQVMDTIQYLRRKAVAAGSLRSDSRITVISQGQIIQIVPAVQQVVYVPYYDPNLAYGSWWWPNNTPVYWNPWPGYQTPYGYDRRLVWGAGIPVGVGLFFGVFDWPHRHVYIRPNRRWEQWRNYNPNRRLEWRHDPDHRRGTPYRSEVVRRRFAEPNRIQGDRGSFRGRPSPATAAPRVDANRQAKPPARPAATTVRQQPAAAGAATTTTTSRIAPAPRLNAPVAQQRTAPPAASRNVRTEQRPTALEGIDRGQAARSFSARGRSSSQSAVREGPSRATAPAPNRAPAASPTQPQSHSPAGASRGPSRND
jgi:hypothetical protein